MVFPQEAPGRPGQERARAAAAAGPGDGRRGEGSPEDHGLRRAGLHWAGKTMGKPAENHGKTGKPSENVGCMVVFHGIL